jgi:hypothetical protein
VPSTTFLKNIGGIRCQIRGASKNTNLKEHVAKKRKLIADVEAFSELFDKAKSVRLVRRANGHVAKSIDDELEEDEST